VIAHITLQRAELRLELLRRRPIRAWLAPIVIESGAAEVGEAGKVAEALQGLKILVPRTRAPVRCEVRVGRPFVQIRTLTGLPPVSRRNLLALLQQQASRYFRATERVLIITARPARSMENGTRAVLAVALDDGLVRELIAAAAALNLRVIRVSAVDGSRAKALPLRFRLPGAQPARPALSLRAAATLIGSAIALASFLAAGYGIWLDRQLKSLRAERHRLEPAANAVALLRRETAGAEAMSAAALEARRRRGEWLARLSAVVAALPDSAVLNRVVIAPAAADSAEGEYQTGGIWSGVSGQRRMEAP